MRLHQDYEVFSEIDIREAPFDVYCNHPSTRIILAAYAFDEGPVNVWEPDQGPRPELRRALLDPAVTIVSWNTNYERNILAGRGMNIPLERWLDPMVLARYAGLPGKLKDCAKIPMIGVPPEEKTKNETLLINKFCKPQKDGTVKTAKDAPEDWKLFVEYCRKDVLTMRHVLGWIEPRFPFLDRERRLWLLDQRINARGFPVDVQLAAAGTRETIRLVSEAQAELKQLTELENPNSLKQLKPWLQERGYQYESLDKEHLARAISAEGDRDSASLV